MTEAALAAPPALAAGQPPIDSVDAVAELLHRMNMEMIALAEGVMAVQAALSPVFSGQSHISGDSIRESQKLDLIEQTLRSLADIAARASQCSVAGPLDIEDITKLCRLSDLADRLRGGVRRDEAAVHHDLELF